VEFLEALGLWEFGDADSLTDKKLIQIDKKYEPYAYHFRGPSDVPGKPPLVRAIQLLLRQACWWRRRRQGHKRTKLLPDLRKAVRAIWHRHGLPFPELCRQLIRDVADYRRTESDLKARRAKALRSWAPQLKKGELVGRPGVWKNGCGTFKRDKHKKVGPRWFADQRRTITASNWLIRGDLGMDEKDCKAYGDLKIKQEAVVARLTGSQDSHAVTKLQAAETPATVSAEQSPAAVGPVSDPQDDKAPPSQRVSLQTRLEDALDSLEAEGTDIRNPPRVSDLETRVMQKTKLSNVSRRTFQRARAAVLRRPPKRPSK
jgi:hypothetical protein